ncbi:MAG: alpha-D-ribose 1-methylphosphonate 5-triphosphate diphosphatase [Granulosicoccus sp.]
MMTVAKSCSTRIVGSRVILPTGVEQTDVQIAQGRIVAIGGQYSPSQQGAFRDGVSEQIQWVEIDGRGKVLAPAMIDIHGDAFERQLMPRPGVMFPMDAAMLETDRQLACNGIATAYHAVTISWEPGLRSLAMAREFFKTLESLRSRLNVDNRVQIRWETFALEAVDFIFERLQQQPVPSLAFNDHTSMIMLHPDVPLQKRPFEQDDDFPTMDIRSGSFRKKMTVRAERSQLPEDEYTDLLLSAWDKRPSVPEAIDIVARAARAVSAPMLSHDDSQVKTRDYYRQLGARVAEFPMQERIAQTAVEQGDWIVFGAPNAVRGGSHIGSPSSEAMIASEQCHILASDYYYPSLLLAVSRLHRECVKPLHELWKLVSTHPAKAMHMTDRGSIETGKRADLVLLDWPDTGEPSPVLTLSAGEVAYSSV